MKDRSGEQLDGRYELKSLLGEGGMGQVYEGTHLITGRRVAVKFLLTELADNAEMIERFHREAKAATAIGSEHICEVLDMSPPVDGQAPYLVMEYLDGESLKERINREKIIPFVDATNIMLQMLEALYAAHKAGIVHRDIKPENIFLVYREDKPVQVKLLDFGISKFNPLGGDNDHSLTKTGTVLGTPYYMSPEQASGDRTVGPLSDLYAAGVILYEVLTGRVPFDAESFSALVVKIVTHTPAHPCELNPHIPREMGDLVLRSMARNSAERYQSAKDMAEALRTVASGQAIPIQSMNAAEASFAAVALPSGGSGSFQTSGSGSFQSATSPLYGGSSDSFTTSDPSLQSQTPMALSRSVGGEGRNGKTWMIVVGVIVLLMLIGGGIAAFLALPSLTGEEDVVAAQPPPPPPPMVPDPIPPVATPPVAVPPVANPGETPVADAGVTESGEVAPAKVRLTVRAAPTVATLYLDDEELEGNPAQVELPADGVTHRVRAEAEGHNPETQEFTASEDGELAFELHRRRQGSRGDQPRPPQPVVERPPVERPTKAPGPRPGATPVSGVVDPWGN